MSLEGRRVLYVSYNGMLEPLGQSQVIPYLRELSKLGVRFTLLSFERASAFNASGRKSSQLLREELSSYGIDWHELRYHQRLSLPATAYDVAAGIRYASRLMRRQKFEMVHARAHIPAVIALALKRRFGTKLIFDVRGLMAEEYVDAEHWRASGIRARLTKSMEARVLRAADGVVTLTDVLWNEMRYWPSVKNGSAAHLTIPCCVDLDRFRFDEGQRKARRAELNVADRFVLVYSGSVGGWYMTDAMAAFFFVLKQKRPEAFFLWLTHGPQEIVNDAMKRAGVAREDYEVRKVSSADVPEFLSAADAAIAFYRPGISRLGTSPVKVSEYMSCGLPVVMNAGIGDSDRFVTQESVGALIENFSEAEYAKAAETLMRLSEHPGDARGRTRAQAEQLFDLKQVGAARYAQLYRQVLG